MKFKYYLLSIVFLPKVMHRLKQNRLQQINAQPALYVYVLMSYFPNMPVKASKIPPLDSLSLS